MQYYEGNLNIATTAAGLAIKQAKDAAAKIANTTHFHINGTLFYVTAKDVAIATDENGTAITIADQMQCMLTVYTDILGTISIGKGKEYTKSSHYTTDKINHASNDHKAILGYIYIKNETGSVFTGGTTALDAASVTAAYVDAYSALGM